MNARRAAASPDAAAFVFARPSGALRETFRAKSPEGVSELILHVVLIVPGLEFAIL